MKVISTSISLLVIALGMANALPTADVEVDASVARAADDSDVSAREVVCILYAGCSGGSNQLQACVNAGYYCAGTGTMALGSPNIYSPSCVSYCQCQNYCYEN